MVCLSINFDVKKFPMDFFGSFQVKNWLKNAILTLLMDFFGSFR